MLSKARLEEIKQKANTCINGQRIYLGYNPDEVLELVNAVEKMREALEDMHRVLINKERETHLSLTSDPPQNGCYVYTEWKLRRIKEKCLAELFTDDEGSALERSSAADKGGVDG